MMISWFLNAIIHGRDFFGEGFQELSYLKISVNQLGYA